MHDAFGHDNIARCRTASLPVAKSTEPATRRLEATIENDKALAPAAVISHKISMTTEIALRASATAQEPPGHEA